MSFQNIVVERDGTLIWLTLNRPDNANAISMELAEEFCAAVDQAENDPGCHVLILKGNGRFFCAGGDVALMVAAQEPAAFLKALAEKMHEGLLRLASSRLVTIAAVHGAAAGAGLGLVLNADVVLASEKASFLSAYGAVGLTPDCGVSYLLPQVVGPRRAAAMTLMGRSATAQEAVDWGLATELVGEGRLVERARELGLAMGGGAAQALGPTKRLLAGDGAGSYAAHLADEAATISAMISHPLTRDTLENFVARRNG